MRSTSILAEQLKQIMHSLFQRHFISVFSVILVYIRIRYIIICFILCVLFICILFVFVYNYVCCIEQLFVLLSIFWFTYNKNVLSPPHPKNKIL